MNRVDADAMRALIATALPEQLAQHGEPLEERYLYLPPAHSRALSLDNMVVQGERGTGKSVWWQALQEARTFHRLAKLQPRTFEARTRVEAGFGRRPDPDRYPGATPLRELLQRHDEHALWRTIVIHQLAQVPGLARIESWEPRVRWVTDHSEAVDRAFYEADQQAIRAGERRLLLFDALDVPDLSWHEQRRLLRGLFRLLLDLRATRSLRGKAFVRPEMINDPEVIAFSDASKVVSDSVRLDWMKVDLYALLFQYLSNGDSGAVFRDACASLGQPCEEADGVFIPSESLRRNEKVQRDVFHRLTGAQMGTGVRSGEPYDWLPNHLADAHARVSPRSFLIALQRAANHPRSVDHSVALHHEAIKAGVQDASQVRVAEIREDFPWVETVMMPLKRQNVHLDPSLVLALWEKAGTLVELRGQVAAGSGASPPRKLGPRRLERQGLQGVIQDLAELGVFQVMRDGRINMPDIYRIAFGLGRRGGIKPVR